MITGYIIKIEGHTQSEELSRICRDSWIKHNINWPVRYFDAITPDKNESIMTRELIDWEYPWDGEHLDMGSGLMKRAYPTKNPGARIACALSHYTLWKQCAKENQPMVILEHDAIFKGKIDRSILETKYDIIGINDPRRATRLAQKYYEEIEIIRKTTNIKVMRVPSIDNFDVPQGLAGNSAYIIKPAGAKKMLALVKEHGLWPNDALMCRQLVKNLGVSTTFYTTIQVHTSTTTL